MDRSGRRSLGYIYLTLPFAAEPSSVASRGPTTFNTIGGVSATGSQRARARAAIDRFDLGVLAALAAVSLAFLLVIFERGGGIFAGWEGFVVADQGQYLAWVREAGDSFLIGNPFDLAPDTQVYLQPPLVVSGLLYKLGLSPSLAYLAWKPVGVLVLFWGARAYVRRTLGGVWARRAALVLALFLAPPLAALAPLWGGSGEGTFDFIAGEIWPAGQLWGYPFAAITIGLMPLVLLAAERRFADGVAGWAPGRYGALAGVGAALASLMHPWQGATLAGIVGVAGLWHLRTESGDARRLAQALWPVIAGAALPVVYFFLLSRLDTSWQFSEDNYRTPLEFDGSWRAAVSLAPLALPALLAYRRPARDLQERMLRVWVPVAALVYVLPSMSVRFHAFNGVSIPLAILAVGGLAPWLERELSSGRRRRLLVTGAVVAVCAVLTVPAAVDRVRSARGAVTLNAQPYHFEQGERDALQALEDAPGPGGVLTTETMGALVPESTGRETYVGSPSWTPDFGERAGFAASLLGGALAPAEAQRLLRATGARFVLADCRGRADLRAALGPLLATATHHGCATVYEISGFR